MAMDQQFAKKSLKVLLDEMAGEHRLRRVLGPVTLTALGIGAVIGAGIFVATGEAAHNTAGPALMLSYVVAGITCVFAALCYAEFASMAPVAGKGIKESAGFNAVMVGIKVAAVLFVICVGAFYVNPANWHPFAPYGLTGVNFFGTTLLGRADAGGQPLGMLAGAAIIFFSYIGFDSVSTHAEEARRPARDVPVGIITSLVICTILYMGVGAVLTGMVPYNRIDINAPVSDAFRQVGLTWAQLIISLGALIGITSVVLVTMLSQARVLLAMARDGLLPRGFFGAVHEKFRTPWKSTILTGVFVALLSSLLPLRILTDLVNIGTLLAFVIVCSAVLIMRRTHPDAERPFRAPFVPLVPILGIASCLLLMLGLRVENWIRLAIWLLVG